MPDTTEDEVLDFWEEIREEATEKWPRWLGGLLCLWIVHSLTNVFLIPNPFAFVAWWGLFVAGIYLLSSFAELVTDIGYWLWEEAEEENYWPLALTGITMAIILVIWIPLWIAA